MNSTPPRRLRFILGLALALALGLGGGSLALRGERANLLEELSVRRGISTLLAVEALVTRAGVVGANRRDLLAAWQAGQPAGTEARVLRLEGASL